MLRLTSVSFINLKIINAGLRFNMSAVKREASRKLSSVSHLRQKHDEDEVEGNKMLAESLIPR